MDDRNIKRVHVFYSGHVQGVGFRYTARSLAKGYEITGWVRNLPDGRVELVAEGPESELVSFLQAVRESGLGPMIYNEEIHWEPAEGNLTGFRIAG